MDGETGGREEFVIMDLINVEEEQFVLMAEGKRSSLVQAMKQCLLAMKTTMVVVRCIKVSGFITTGDSW